jgi:hypothetical protein
MFQKFGLARFRGMMPELSLFLCFRYKDSSPQDSVPLRPASTRLVQLIREILTKSVSAGMTSEKRRLVVRDEEWILSPNF